MMNIPPQALNLIKTFEGLRLNRYLDITGHGTIGYGHEIKPGENFPETITEEEADKLLNEDAENAASAVRYLTSVPLNEDQYSALIDFVYNLGSGTYERSTLRMVINREEYSKAPKEFLKYVYAGPHVSLGLARRRMAEVELWNAQIETRTGTD